MPKLWWLSPLLLAACAAAPAEIPVRGETPGHLCKATATAKFIGRLKTAKTAAAIKHATGASVLRWAPPGMMMTMDYRGDRVTVTLGPDGKITRISCG